MTKTKETTPVVIPMVIQRSELPLSCPRPSVSVWNLHPKIYLPIEKTGKETCPYCGAQYVLGDEG